VLASVIAAFFYLRLIVLMWLQEPVGDTGVIGLSAPGALVLSITAAATIFFGVYPEAIMHLARTAAFFTG
jgi:NADH-quinone oxidoreductase subunit N